MKNGNFSCLTEQVLSFRCTEARHENDPFNMS